MLPERDCFVELDLTSKCIKGLPLESCSCRPWEAVWLARVTGSLSPVGRPGLSSQNTKMMDAITYPDIKDSLRPGVDEVTME